MMTLLSPAANYAFPIRTVAAMTGIDLATLRTWERCYHPEPGRTPKVHRQYSKKQTAMPHRVVALLERGVALSHINEAYLPVFVGDPTSAILGDAVQHAGATALGAYGSFGFQRIDVRLNDGGRSSATDKNKNTIKQISQENSCSSQV